MSEEQLKAFLEAVKADAGLQEQLKGAADADAVVAIAKRAGYVISEKLREAPSELSDNELKMTGGVGSFLDWSEIPPEIQEEIQNLTRGGDVPFRKIFDQILPF